MGLSDNDVKRDAALREITRRCAADPDYAAYVQRMLMAASDGMLDVWERVGAILDEHGM